MYKYIQVNVKTQASVTIPIIWNCCWTEFCANSS